MEQSYFKTNILILNNNYCLLLLLTILYNFKDMLMHFIPRSILILKFIETIADIPSIWDFYDLSYIIQFIHIIEHL